jgi:hypothetical protein
MTQSIDGARLTLILNDLRLPAIKQGWSAFAERAASSPRSPSTRSPNETAAASSAISSKHGCCPERPSTASTSRRCR